MSASRPSPKNCPPCERRPSRLVTRRSAQCLTTDQSQSQVKIQEKCIKPRRHYPPPTYNERHQSSEYGPKQKSSKNHECERRVPEPEIEADFSNCSGKSNQYIFPTRTRPSPKYQSQSTQRRLSRYEAYRDRQYLGSDQSQSQLKCREYSTRTRRCEPKKKGTVCCPCVPKRSKSRSDSCSNLKKDPYLESDCSSVYKPKYRSSRCKCPDKKPETEYPRYWEYRQPEEKRKCPRTARYGLVPGRACKPYKKYCTTSESETEERKNCQPVKCAPTSKCTKPQKPVECSPTCMPAPEPKSQCCYSQPQEESPADMYRKPRKCKPQSSAHSVQQRPSACHRTRSEPKCVPSKKLEASSELVVLCEKSTKQRACDCRESKANVPRRRCPEPIDGRKIRNSVYGQHASASRPSYEPKSDQSADVLQPLKKTRSPCQCRSSKPESKNVPWREPLTGSQLEELCDRSTKQRAATDRRESKASVSRRRYSDPNDERRNRNSAYGQRASASRPSYDPKSDQSEEKLQPGRNYRSPYQCRCSKSESKNVPWREPRTGSQSELLGDKLTTDRLNDRRESKARVPRRRCSDYTYQIKCTISAQRTTASAPRPSRDRKSEETPIDPSEKEINQEENNQSIDPIEPEKVPSIEKQTSSQLEDLIDAPTTERLSGQPESKMDEPDQTDEEKKKLSVSSQRESASSKSEETPTDPSDPSEKVLSQEKNTRSTDCPKSCCPCPKSEPEKGPSIEKQTSSQLEDMIDAPTTDQLSVQPESKMNESTCQCPDRTNEEKFLISVRCSPVSQPTFAYDLKCEETPTDQSEEVLQHSPRQCPCPKSENQNVPSRKSRNRNQLEEFLSGKQRATDRRESKASVPRRRCTDTMDEGKNRNSVCERRPSASRPSYEPKYVEGQNDQSERASVSVKKTRSRRQCPCPKSENQNAPSRKYLTGSQLDVMCDRSTKQRAPNDRRESKASAPRRRYTDPTDEGKNRNSAYGQRASASRPSYEPKSDQSADALQPVRNSRSPGQSTSVKSDPKNMPSRKRKPSSQLEDFYDKTTTNRLSDQPDQYQWAYKKAEDIHKRVEESTDQSADVLQPVKNSRSPGQCPCPKSENQNIPSRKCRNRNQLDELLSTKQRPIDRRESKASVSRRRCTDPIDEGKNRSSVCGQRAAACRPRCEPKCVPPPPKKRRSSCCRSKSETTCLPSIKPSTCVQSNCVPSTCVQSTCVQSEISTCSSRKYVYNRPDCRPKRRPIDQSKNSNPVGCQIRSRSSKKSEYIETDSSKCLFSDQYKPTEKYLIREERRRSCISTCFPVRTNNNLKNSSKLIDSSEFLSSEECLQPKTIPRSKMLRPNCQDSSPSTSSVLSPRCSRDISKKSCNCDEGKEVEKLREYLRIKSSHPNVDYTKCVDYLCKQAVESELKYRVVTPGGVQYPIVVMTQLGKDEALPSIMLCSHMDVVGVNPDKWSFPPFGAEIDANHKIYARGAQDMKTVSMQYLAALRGLKRDKITLTRTVHLVFVSDAEAGGENGMQAFIKSKTFQNLGVGFALGEGLPSPNDIYNFYYGERFTWHVTYTVSDCGEYSSAYTQDKCEMKLLKIMDKLIEYDSVEKKRLDNDPNLSLGDITSVNLIKTESATVSQSNRNTTKMSMTYDVRLSLDRHPREFEMQLRLWIREAGGGITMTFKHKEFPVIPTPIDNQFVQTMKRTMSSLGHKTEDRICPRSTDNRFLREINIPTIGFTPITKTPILLHGDDEYITAQEFIRGILIYKKIIIAIASGRQSIIPNH